MRLASLALLSAALLASPATSQLRAQSPSQAPPVSSAEVKASPDLAGIAHIALRVHDIAASTAFYQKLGFEKAFELSRNGQVYETFLKINDHQFIELYPATEKNPQTGFLHVCFEGRNLQAAHDFYVAHGLTPNAVRTAGAGNLLFTMPGPATPSGPQNMEYTQYMPASMHSKDVGQHLGANRIATEIVAVAIAANDPDAAVAFYTEKAGFTREHPIPGGGTLLAIPGSSGESIAIVPASGLGYKSAIGLNTSAEKARKLLQQRGITVVTMETQSVVTDPDGNYIGFAGK